MYLISITSPHFFLPLSTGKFWPHDHITLHCFSGPLSLTTFWPSEQRVYKAHYEKNKDKFTITTDDPRYQLARENRKMSQVNTRTACCRTGLLLPPFLVLQTSDTGAWGHPQTCRWSSSHGSFALQSLIILSICPTQADVIAAGTLSWVCRTQYLCH